VGGAVFVDYDNSGAQSLFLMMAYGKSRLLKNMLPVTGKPEFVDVTEQAGFRNIRLPLPQPSSTMTVTASSIC